MSVALLLAWLLPLAGGVALYCLANPPRGAGWIAATLGHGMVFGMLLAAAATALFARADTTHALAHVSPWLALFALVVAALAWWRARTTASAMSSWQRTSENPLQMEKWKTAVIGAAILSLLWRGWLALREILLRPTYPWDAWDAWAVKSKTWFLLGHYAPFVSMREWLGQRTAEVYTGPAWSYPPTLAWIQVWFASAAGGWIEPLVNLPWLALWLGLLAAHYGQWRALGLTRAKALIFVYILGSLPLVTVHVALAGYADLWMAAMFGLAVLAWMRWLEQRDRGQLLLSILCALSLPLLKFEGAVWLLLFAGVAGYALVPVRWRRYFAGSLLLLLIAGIAFGRLMLPLFGLGWVNIGVDAIDIPVLGRLAIEWHSGAFTSVLSSLFAQSNWHLLWWLVPALVVWRWRQLRASESLRLLGLLLLAGFCFLVFLFLFTDAARWAESYTAINRLVMHITPAVVTLLALLCRDLDFHDLDFHLAARDTAPASVQPSDPA